MNAVAISFLKSKKVDYYVDDQHIIFPCFNCKYGKAHMNVISAVWTCMNCNATGNLLNLNTMWNEMISRDGVLESKVYNPRKERQSIISSLEQLCQKYPNDLQLKNTNSRAKILLDFLLIEQ